MVAVQSGDNEVQHRSELNDVVKAELETASEYLRKTMRWHKPASPFMAATSNTTSSSVGGSTADITVHYYRVLNFYISEHQSCRQGSTRKLFSMNCLQP